MTPKLAPTLAELRALPHLSISQLKTYVQCPRKYRLQYVDGVAMAFRPVALAFGTAWHEAVGHHLLHSTPEMHVDREDVRAIFRDKLALALAADDTPVLLDEGEHEETLVDQGLRMLEVFLDRLPIPDRIVGVELPFRLEIVDPEYGDRLATPLVGALDALVVHEGRSAVWELKTAKKKWSADQLAYDLQPTAYAMAAEQIGHDDPELVLLVTTKTTKPDVQIERLVRTQADRDDLAVTAQSVTAAIAAGIDHPVRGWACRGCSVAHACR